MFMALFGGKDSHRSVWCNGHRFGAKATWAGGKHNWSVAPRLMLRIYPKVSLMKRQLRNRKLLLVMSMAFLLTLRRLPSLACNWMDGFESDLGLGDEGDDEDDSSVDEGVPASDAVGEGCLTTYLFGTIVGTPLPCTRLFHVMPHLHQHLKMITVVSTLRTTTTLHLKKVDDAVTIGKISARSLTLERNCEKAVHHESTKGLPNLLPLVGQETCGCVICCA
ncbi:hypothetical protein MHU86_23155 [Fragilaria crotonensis]|nr:hypothetical protein MHU86_23155 [Fragilaria crotonensis]